MHINQMPHPVTARYTLNSIEAALNQSSQLAKQFVELQCPAQAVPLCCISAHHGECHYKWSDLKAHKSEFTMTPVLYVKKPGLHQCTMQKISNSKDMCVSHIFNVQFIQGIKEQHKKITSQSLQSPVLYIKKIRQRQLEHYPYMASRLAPRKMGKGKEPMAQGKAAGFKSQAQFDREREERLRRMRERSLGCISFKKGSSFVLNLILSGGM